jgi:hypothetical protein
MADAPAKPLLLLAYARSMIIVEFDGETAERISSENPTEDDSRTRTGSM